MAVSANFSVLAGHTRCSGKSNTEAKNEKEVLMKELDEYKEKNEELLLKLTALNEHDESAKQFFQQCRNGRNPDLRIKNKMLKIDLQKAQCKIYYLEEEEKFWKGMYEATNTIAEKELLMKELDKYRKKNEELELKLISAQKGHDFAQNVRENEHDLRTENEMLKICLQKKEHRIYCLDEEASFYKMMYQEK